MKFTIFAIALLLTTMLSPDKACASAGNEVSTELFGDKALVAPHIHVESTAQFAKWDGKAVPPGDYNENSYEKIRLGTVIFGKNLRVHIDFIRDTVHFPSYYELVDVVSGAVLGKYAVFDLEDGNWYFSGNGTAYLNQRHLSLCGPRYTRKIIQKAHSLIEVSQPLLYIGTDTEVQSTTPLYESPTNRVTVATLTKGTKAFLIGVQPGKFGVLDVAFLVKTPLGLTGWHIAEGKAESGSLDIYQCN